MSATKADFSFSELLDANERETGKWQSWLERQPSELLDLPLNIALAKNVREFPAAHFCRAAALPRTPAR